MPLSASLNRRLSALEPGRMKLGLERMRQAADRLGAPHSAGETRWILVGGTNGKGSCVAFLDAILREAGLRVGAYTSPHLMDLCERVSLGGEFISSDRFGEDLNRVLPLVEEEKIPLTYFEVVTLAAFSFFAAERIDVGILEVGLGGRLDATNIVDPSVSVITSIARDHTRWLGESEAEIAWEKGGITRAGIPLVTALNGELLDAALRDRPVPCPVHCLGDHFRMVEMDDGWTYQYDEGQLGPLNLGLEGAHQRANAALAIRAAQVLCPALDGQAIIRGVGQTRLLGRFQVLRWEGVECVLDGAHNAHAMGALSSCLDASPLQRPRIAIFAAKDDKQVDEMIEILDPWVDGWIVTSVDAPSMLGEEALARTVHDHSDKAVEIEPSIGEALLRARAVVGERGSVLVTGSLYLVGAALQIVRERPSPSLSR